jgi:hypothetical protein
MKEAGNQKLNNLSRAGQARSVKMRGDFVLLRADSLRLLVPQRDISSTDYLDRIPAATAEQGVFVLGEGTGANQEVQALSEQMERLARFPSDRFLLTRFASPYQMTALAWTEVRVLIDAELEFHALPAVMQGDGALIDAYVEIDKDLAFCTTAQRMLPEVLMQPG